RDRRAERARLRKGRAAGKAAQGVAIIPARFARAEVGHDGLVGLDHPRRGAARRGAARDRRTVLSRVHRHIRNPGRPRRHRRTGPAAVDRVAVVRRALGPDDVHAAAAALREDAGQGAPRGGRRRRRPHRAPAGARAGQVVPHRVWGVVVDGGQRRNAADSGRRGSPHRGGRRADAARAQRRWGRVAAGPGRVEEKLMDQYAFWVVIALTVLVIIVIAKTAVVVPQQSAYIVEMLGKYSRTLQAGFHILIPFVERVAYKHTLKEQAIDIPEQVCITKDNVQAGIDGVLYLRVLDPARASYGISDYVFAISQLAQTTLRSEIGKIDLDRTFEERASINANVVTELDKASEPWGVKVLRYEIRNINPPADVLQAMEKQMRAEREKRALILTSEGERDAKINQAEGEKQRIIKASEAAREQQINEAAGEAEAILAVAKATAEGLRLVAEAVSGEGGLEAMQLRIAEDYVRQFGHLAKSANTLVVPANLSDVAGMIALATRIFGDAKSPGPELPPGMMTPKSTGFAG